jgi:precorrin-3B C17-methyltransferase
MRSDNIKKGFEREGGLVIATTLGSLMKYDNIIDLSTIVLISNSESRQWKNRKITPRGYKRKYGD